MNHGEEEEERGAEGLGGVSGHAFGHDCPLGLGYRKRGPRGGDENTITTYTTCTQYVRSCRRFRRYLSTGWLCSSRVCVVKPCLDISPGLQFCRSFNVVLFSLPSLLFPTNPFSSPPPPPPHALAPETDLVRTRHSPWRQTLAAFIRSGPEGPLVSGQHPFFATSAVPQSVLVSTLSRHSRR